MAKKNNNKTATTTTVNGVEQPKVKKPLTAFMFFNMSIRPTVVLENPGIAFGDVGKKIGEKWKAMDEEAKKPFAKQAADDKKRYELAMGKVVATPSADSVADDSVVNESVVNESVAADSVVNESVAADSVVADGIVADSVVADAIDVPSVGMEVVVPVVIEVQ